jgi:tripartite-type tricarboxylate transporter receptor subunit TctC
MLQRLFTLRTDARVRLRALFLTHPREGDSTTYHRMEEISMGRIARGALAVALLSMSGFPALAAEAYPQRSIRIVIPFSPGGGTDVLARGISDKLNEALGASVVIDNRPGAAGTLGVGMVAASAPDGYTLLLTSASFSFAPSLYKDLPYDALRDLKPITNFASIPNLLVVHPSVPAKSVKQLVDLAHRRPGDVFYSSAGRGSNLHLTTELFAYMAKIKLLQVPYKGGGPAMIALMAGEVHMNFPGIQAGFPHVRSGRMRALGVSTKARSALLPDVPTIDEAGVPGYDKAGWYGMFAPRAVPQPIIEHVYNGVARVLKDPVVMKRLANEGAVPVANPPDEFEAFVRAEITTWADLIREMKL